MGKVRAWFEDKRIAYQQARGRMREWCRNNPREATMLGIVGISTVGGIVKASIQYKAKRVQQQPSTLWDPSMGYHQTLKKPLTPAMKADINRLTSRGYSRHEALDILGLI